MEQKELDETLNTRELAELIRVDPQTIRHALCLRGHYLGLKPVKLPNKRLLWSGNKARQLAEQGR